jgi:hypothetical protein
MRKLIWLMLLPSAWSNAVEKNVTLTPITTPIITASQLVEVIKITPIAHWGGQTGKIGSGDRGYICNQDNLNGFWKKWEIAKLKPKIDFNKELAVYYLGSGGPHLMNLSLDESGNLVAEYVESPTVSLQPNYLIFTVLRHGIKSLNGIPVMCSE